MRSMPALSWSLGLIIFSPKGILFTPWEAAGQLAPVSWSMAPDEPLVALCPRSPAQPGQLFQEQAILWACPFRTPCHVLVTEQVAI